METLTMIFAVLIILSFVAVIFAGAGYASQASTKKEADAIGNALLQFEKNNTETANGLTYNVVNALATGNEALANTLSTSLNASDIKLNGLSANVGTVSAGIAGGINGVNANISTLHTLVAGSTNSQNANLTSAIANFNAILIKGLAAQANVINSLLAQQSNSLVITIGPTNLTTANYIFGSLLPGYSNKLTVTSINSVNLYLLTAPNFAQLAENKTYSAISSFSGNNIANIFANQSESCSRDVYVIATTTNTLITVNDLVSYSPANIIQGVC